MAEPDPNTPGAEPAGEETSGRPQGRGIVSNAVFSLLSQGTTGLFTLVLTLFLVRQLGPEGYGVFTLTLSIGAIAVMLADFGIAPSGARYVAEDLDDPDRVGTVTRVVLRLKLIAAGGVAVALFVLAPVIASIFGDGDELTWPLRAMAFSLLGEAMMMLFANAFGALRRQHLNARMVFLESLTEATASIGIVLLGAGVTGALLGRGIGYATGTLVGLWLLSRVLGRPSLRRREGDRRVAQAVFGYAKPLLVINGAYALFVYTDALLVGAFLTTTDVAQLTAPQRIITIVGYAGIAVSAAVAPRMAGTDPDVEGFTRWLRYVTCVQMLLVAPLLAWATPIVDLALGPGYDLADDVLRGLVPYAFLIGVGPLITVTVVYLGDARRRVPIVMASLIINSVIDVILLPIIGVMGAVIGAVIGMAIFVPAHLRVCVRRLGLPVAPILVTLLRALVAGAAAAGVLALLGTDDLAVWQWAAGAVAAPLAFLAVLVATGELRRSEVTAAAAWLRAGLRRGA